MAGLGFNNPAIFILSQFFFAATAWSDVKTYKES